MKTPSILFIAAAIGACHHHGANSAATTAQARERYYADALEELEHEIGSGVHQNKPSSHQQQQHDRRGQSSSAALHDAEEMAGYKKKVDKRKAERERRAMDDIQELNERVQYFENQKLNDEGGHGGRGGVREQFHQRQKEKRIRLDEMHREVSETLAAHEDGRRLLSEEELENHTRRRAALERKRSSLENETPEKYMERMNRHEEKLLEKLARKKKRHEERFKRREEEL